MKGDKNDGTHRMPRTLVVYYSHSGHSKAAAEAIAKQLGADIEPIVTLRHSPRGVLGFIRAGFASLRGHAWPVQPPRADLDTYDCVVLCAPVWAGRLAPPARAWLRDASGRIHALAACATIGGTNPGGFFADVAALLARPVLAQATIADANRKSGADADIIGRFAAELTQAGADGTDAQPRQ